MPVKKVTSKKVSKVTKVLKVSKVKTSKTRGISLSVPVYSLAGRTSGALSLPKEIFGVKVNQQLLSQATRVYMTNKKQHHGSTKTRGEVRGSTAKIWRQKGTGRARHGAKTAPIFVGGGVAFGPRPRKVKLELPKKMKKAALMSALSARMGDQGILGVSGLEKASGKTKEMAQFLTKLSEKGTPRLRSGQEEKNEKSKTVLIITGKKQDNVVRGVRNIPGVNVLPANQINAYEVLRHQILLISKDAVEKLGKGE